jgi:hypothetical protein
MKASELHIVEGDPELGGCHVKRLADVLALNEAAFVAGEPRRMLALSAQPTLEQALVAERELKRLRAEARRNADGVGGADLFNHEGAKEHKGDGE